MQTGRRILSVLAAVLLISASALSAAWNLGATQFDLGLPAIVPDDPDIALGHAIVEFRKKAIPPSPEGFAKVKAAAGLDPLEEEPLLLASLTNIKSDHERAIELLSEARRRNPASREARILLLDRYLRTGDITGVVGEVGALMTLLPETERKDLSSVLLSLVAAPETRHDAVEALRSSSMRKQLLVELARAGASSYLLLDLSKDLTSLAPNGSEGKWSQSVTSALVDKGDFTGAHRLWRHFFSIPSDVSTVTDGTFSGSAAPPFGWLLTSKPGSFVAFESDGLRIRYDGKQSTMFARQLLMLTPGRYRFSEKIDAKSDARPNLAWRIDCLQSGETIFNRATGEVFSFESEQSPEFAVPSSECPAQWLALAGRPLPVSSMRTTLIKSIDVKPVIGE